MNTSTLFKLGSGTIWFKGSPLALIAIVLIVDAFNGFHSFEGEEKRKVPLKQGAMGPVEFPGIQVLDCPHHPHLGLFTQLSGIVEKTLQSMWIAFKLSLPL